MKNYIQILRNKFKKYEIDGYVVPKNDDYFSEYSKINRLKIISNFSGSAGLAIILKNKNYLFTDGRYTIQSEVESGKYFKIFGFEKLVNCNLFKNLTLGIDPKLFTNTQIKKFFLKNNKIKQIQSKSIERIFRKKLSKSKPFFSLDKKIVGEGHSSKIKRIVKYLKKVKSDYLFISAPENIAWLLNIRGHDNPYSPIPNCRLLINDVGNIHLIVEMKKVRKIIKEKKIKKEQVIEPKNFESFVDKLNKNRIIIDNKSCSIFYEEILKKKIYNSKKRRSNIFFKIT